MALIPLIQPPIMKLLTSEEDRKIKMVQARVVSKSEKILFPIIVTIFVILLLPSTAPLVGCLMLGNLFRECGVTERLSDTVQNALMNIVTIMLSTSVGATMVASNFLKLETLKIILLGLIAFGISTVGGLIGGNIMCKLSGKKVNPPHRLGRRLRCPDGRACFADGRPEGQPLELPADARHGTQRRRCYRLGNRGRLPAGSVRLKYPAEKA